MQSRFHRLARLYTLAFLLAAALFSCRHAAAQSYTITQLGDLGGNQTIAVSINNVGQVVGRSFLTPLGINPPVYHAFLWQNGVMTDLGSPGGTLSQATAINDSGQIVGYAGNISLGFLWDKGVWTGIPTFGGHASEAYAINRFGQIVGSANTRRINPTSFLDGPPNGFVWQNGGMTDLGTLSARVYVSEAYGMNNVGQIVGSSLLPINGHTEAVLWQNGHIQDIGNLGGDSSVATSINDTGQVVGHANTADGAEHAFLWQNGVMTDLAIIQGFTGSKADGINKAGQIVGYSQPPGGLTKATIWQNGVVTDLNTLIPAGTGWQLEEAWSINDAGQIVGDGEINGNDLSFLLTPYPTADPQTESPDFGKPTAIALTGVDHNSPPLKLKFAIAVQPANGKLTGLNTSTGAVTYTPNTGFNGTDSFTFTVNNGNVTSAAAKVAINVAPGTPTASAQTVAVAHNAGKSITLTGKDPDVPALPLTYAIAKGPAHGALGTLNTSTGVVIYTPSAGSDGADSFTFTVSNGTNSSADATVTLNLAAGTPAANPQTVAVARNTDKTITLTGADPDSPPLKLTFSVASKPTHGVLGAVNAATGAVIYEPNRNSGGMDSFTFTVSNGANTSAAARVTLNVAPGTPTANAQTIAVAHNTGKSITLTGKDSDVPALPLTYAIAKGPIHGALGTLNTSTGVVIYTPSAGFNGTDSLTFTVSNGTNTSAAATVTLDVSAGTPTAKVQTVTVLHNTAAAITLTGTDPDIPALKLTFAIVAAPANGALSGLNATTGAVKYTPKANFQGADSFTFTVSNGTNTSAAATVTLRVAPGMPTAKAQTVTVLHNTAAAITLKGTDPDIPALKLTFAIVAAPANGSLSGLNATTGAVKYTPKANFQGSDSFTFTVSNGTNTSAVATVTLRVALGTPTAHAQTVTVALYTKITITLTGSDPDVPALPLRFAIASQPAHGVLGSLNAATGVLAYKPDIKYKGTDSFTFTVSNGTNKSAAAAVTLKVGG